MRKYISTVMYVLLSRHSNIRTCLFTCKGYPTWEINGELYPGEKSLDELGELSGFKG